MKISIPFSLYWLVNKYPYVSFFWVVLIPKPSQACPGNVVGLTGWKSNSQVPAREALPAMASFQRSPRWDVEPMAHHGIETNSLWRNLDDSWVIYYNSGWFHDFMLEIWVNYNMSLTWNVGLFGDDSPYELTNHDSSEEEQWGRYNLPREMNVTMA